MSLASLRREIAMVNPSRRLAISNRHRLCRWLATAVVVFAVAGCSAGPAPQMAQEVAPERATENEPAQIESVALRVEGGGYLVEVTGNQPLVWTSYRDQDGRLVVELPNAVAAAGAAGVPDGDGFVESVAVEKQDGDRPLTRIVVATREASEHSLFSEGNGLSIQLTPVGMEMASAEMTEEAAVAADQVVEADLEPEAADDAWFTEESAEESWLTEEAEVADLGEAEAAEVEAVAEADAAEAAVADYGTDAMPALGPEPQGVEASNLHTVDVALVDGQTVVRLRGDGEFRYSTFHLENPERFVVDVFGVVNLVDAKILPVERGAIDGVRIAQFRPRPDLVARVVVDLADRVMPRIDNVTDGVDLSFAAGGEAAAWSEPAAEETEVAWVEEPAADEWQAEEIETPASTPVEDHEAEAYEETGTHDTELNTAEMATNDPEAYEAARWDEPADLAEPEEVAQLDEMAAYEAETNEPAVTEMPNDEMPALEVAAEVTAAPASDWATPAEPATEVSYYEAAEVDDSLSDQSSSSAVAAFEAQTIGATERKYIGEPMTMTLKNGDVKDVLRSFAEISGLNLVVDPEVSGSVTVELVDVPWDQALDQVLKINRLGYTLEGTIMRVAPIAKLQEEAAERQALAEAQALSVPLTTIIQRISYADAGDVAGLLRGGASGLLSQRGSVTVDGRTNTLIIKELPDFINTVIAVIENLDIPEPQVMIEARIVETTKRFSRSIGVDWGFDALASAATGNTTGLVFPNQGEASGGVSLLTGGANGFLNFRLGNVLNTFQLDATLQAAENEGLINILSAPKIATLNNEAASIQSGLQIPIQTVANNTVSVQFVNATLKLEVTPHVTAEGTVLMDIDIQKREPQLAFAVVGATNAPIATKEARTRVIVRDGGTTVIGGIYEVSTDQGEDRVPGLANVPLIKHLFKNRRRTEENEELLIFITPRVIKL